MPMPTDYFATFFPTACAGFGLLVAGGANLLLLRKGFAARAAATVAGLGLGVGAAAALDQPGATLATAKLLGIGLIAFLLLSWGGFVNRVAGLVASLQRPAVRFGLVTLAGVATIVGATAYFQWADEKAANESLNELELIQGRVPTVPSNRGKATTDQGTTIVLKEPVPREPVDLASAEEKVLRAGNLSEHVIRRGSASDESNCHGWVFTGGKFLLGPEDVELILKENGYQEVYEPQTGDLVVYRTAGAVAHTSIVRYVTEGQPVLVEGKWGNLGIFLHPADKSAYGTDYTFHRSPRTSHLLAGVGGPATSAETRPAVVTE
jgi:hypothetical protein